MKVFTLANSPGNLITKPDDTAACQRIYREITKNFDYLCARDENNTADKLLIV